MQDRLQNIWNSINDYETQVSENINTIEAINNTSVLNDSELKDIIKQYKDLLKKNSSPIAIYLDFIKACRNICVIHSQKFKRQWGSIADYKHDDKFTSFVNDLDKMLSPEDVINRMENTEEVFTDESFILVGGTGNYESYNITQLIKSCIGIYAQLYQTSDIPITHTIMLKRVVEVDAKIAYLGDYHGSLHDLVKSITDLKEKQWFEEKTWRLKKNHYIVFLGDLVDRAPLGVECLYVVFSLFSVNNRDKNSHSQNVYILNGNHEDPELYNEFGLTDEMTLQFQNRKETQTLMNQLMLLLPDVLFIKKDSSKWLQLCHGGIDVYSQEQSNIVKDFLDNSSVGESFYNLGGGHVTTGYKWTDFDLGVENYIFNFKRNSGHVFGYQATVRTANKHNIQSFITGHQDRVPLNIMPYKDTRALDNITSDFIRGGHNNIYPGLYGLTHVTLEELIQGGSISLDLNNVLALTTSSATLTKNVPINSYGVLNMINYSTEIYFSESAYHPRHLFDGSSYSDYLKQFS